MTTFNLLMARWLPMVSKTGRLLLRPSDVVEHASNMPRRLDWPRADFRMACLEMLIGLLATECPPADEDEWRKWWDSPPSPETLAEKFAPLAIAFDLDGDGPRFCQDIEDFAGESLPIERLLIDAPGENTVKRNTDLLVKRDRIKVLGRPAAAMALYTLQAFAPSGGAGHRTSLRGGGPLVTLVAPADGMQPRSLWRLLWANVPDGIPPDPVELPLVFPWLAPTRRSERDAGTVLDSPQGHRLQAFWGMPRRIRLDFRPARPGEVCDLTGEPDIVVATGFRTRPWGVKYVESAHHHPLTPSYKPKTGGLPLPLHPQPDGIGYRHWSGLVSPGDASEPAVAVTNFLRRRPLGDPGQWEEARLLVGGYDMDNMKARSFVEAEMPLFVMPGDKRRRTFQAFARDMANGATEAAGILRMQLRLALDAESDNAVIDSARQRFFELTTSGFWSMLRVAADQEALDDSREITAGAWLRTLRRTALALYDEAAPLDPLAPNAAGRMVGGKWEPPKVVVARRNLGTALAGYGKMGETLFERLGLERPEASRKAKVTRRTRQDA